MSHRAVKSYEAEAARSKRARGSLSSLVTAPDALVALACLLARQAAAEAMQNSVIFQGGAPHYECIGSTRMVAASADDR